MVDPKGEDFSIYKGAYLIKPNLQEFQTIVGPVKNEKDMVRKARIAFKLQPIITAIFANSPLGILDKNLGRSSLRFRDLKSVVFPP